MTALSVGVFSWMDNAHSTHGQTQQAAHGEKCPQNHFQAFYWTSGAWLKLMQNKTQQPFKPQHEIVTKKCIYNDTQQLQSVSKRVLISLWTWNDKKWEVEWRSNCFRVCSIWFSFISHPNYCKNSSGCPQRVSDQVILIVQIEATCARVLGLKE